MARSYSTKFLISLNNSDQNKTGLALAKLCVEAGIPSVHVARVFKVSRMTIHSWFRGTKIRQSRMEEVEAFMRLVQKDMGKGILPVETTQDAKAYIDEMLGE
jgi:uncharacterized protein HemY